MWNGRLDEAQAGIKTAGRNINNLRYADDTTLMAESEEELKNHLIKMKEDSEKAGLKLNIQNTKTMASGSITSWQSDGETVETVTDFILGGSKITEDGDCSHEIKRFLLLGRKVMTNLVQFSSVAQSCPTLCNPMNRSTPGLPVHHQLPEFTQTHVHRVSDAIEPSHPLSSPSPPAPNPFQHQSLFQWVNTSHEVAKVLSALASFLPKKSQGWSPSEWTAWISLQSMGLSRVFSNPTVQKHQFFSAQPSSQSNSHIHTWPQEKS